MKLTHDALMLKFIHETTEGTSSNCCIIGDELHYGGRRVAKKINGTRVVLLDATNNVVTRASREFLDRLLLILKLNDKITVSINNISPEGIRGRINYYNGEIREHWEGFSYKGGNPGYRNRLKEAIKEKRELVDALTTLLEEEITT